MQEPHNMRRFERDRSALSSLCLGCAVALGISAPSAALAISSLGRGVERSSTSPAALAGRYERASAQGAYIDVHGPFTAAEVHLVAGYRGADGRPVVAPR
jgi:hypothetical protein